MPKRILKYGSEQRRGSDIFGRREKDSPAKVQESSSEDSSRSPNIQKQTIKMSETEDSNIRTSAAAYGKEIFERSIEKVVSPKRGKLTKRNVKVENLDADIDNIYRIEEKSTGNSNLQINVNEKEANEELNALNECLFQPTFRDVLSHRGKILREIRHLWDEGAITSLSLLAKHENDIGISCAILKGLKLSSLQNTQGKISPLQLFPALAPLIEKALKSQYADFVIDGLQALTIFLKILIPSFKAIRKLPQNAIPHETKLLECDHCWSTLLIFRKTVTSLTHLSNDTIQRKACKVENLLSSLSVDCRT
eukprot:g1592.t1